MATWFQSDRIESPAADRDESPGSLSSGVTLDGLAHDPGCVEGVALQTLEAGTVLSVMTRHSRYRLVVLDGPRQRALATGGSLFEESTEVRVEGATAGGSAVKTGWIGVGLRLELSLGVQRVITSTVQSITIDGVPPRQGRLTS